MRVKEIKLLEKFPDPLLSSYRKKSHDLVGLFSELRRSRRQTWIAWLSWNYGNGGRKTA